MKSHFLWNLSCAVSILGIWPRFIEPYLIFTTNLIFPINNLPDDLEGLKILQLSDLHWNDRSCKHFFNKILLKVKAQKPDLIVITGDLIDHSQIYEPSFFCNFLQNLKAPLGCFASLGNHDYSHPLSLNIKGDYDVKKKSESFLKRGLQRFFLNEPPTGIITAEAQQVRLNNNLIQLLKDASIHLLDNETTLIKIGKSFLNICGLGEYMNNRFNPELAFKKYDLNFPGIILSHNPDTAPKLASYPGDIILSGHTHGGQVNLPYIWKKLALLEKNKFKRGLVKIEGKSIYINRGIGSTAPFRLFSPPEILLLTLTRAKNE